MAELLGASRERGGPGEGGPQSVHAADRSRMRELRCPSGTRIRRWASADRASVLHQLGLVAIRSTIARVLAGGMSIEEVPSVPSCRGFCVTMPVRARLRTFQVPFSISLNRPANFGGLPGEKMADQPKPGSIVHVEFHVKDRKKVENFYGSLFGWKFQEVPELNYSIFEAPSGLGEAVGDFAGTPRSRSVARTSRPSVPLPLIFRAGAPPSV